jgi:hypothetical protein
MPDMFQVYGDYGYTSQTLLKDSGSVSECTQWVERYMRDGDWGGYSVIEIARHLPDGEYDVAMRWEKDDDTYDEHWDWNNTASPLHY